MVDAAAPSIINIRYCHHYKHFLHKSYSLEIRTYVHIHVYILGTCVSARTMYLHLLLVLLLYRMCICSAHT